VRGETEWKKLYNDVEMERRSILKLEYKGENTLEKVGTHSFFISETIILDSGSNFF